MPISVDKINTNKPVMPVVYNVILTTILTIIILIISIILLFFDMRDTLILSEISIVINEATLTTNKYTKIYTNMLCVVMLEMLSIITATPERALFIR